MVLQSRGRVLDPSCGDGSLLIAVADEAVAMGRSPKTVYQSLVGWDIDPWAAWLARARLVEWAVKHGVSGSPDIVAAGRRARR